MSEDTFAFELEAGGQDLSLGLLDRLLTGTRLKVGMGKTIEIIWPENQERRYVRFGKKVVPLHFQGHRAFVNPAVPIDEVHTLVIVKGAAVKSRIKGLAA